MTDTLEQMQAMTAGTLAARMGIALTHVRAERVEGTMPVDGNTQPAGLLPGGACCVLAEPPGSVARAVPAAPRPAARTARPQ